jgi:hypothetical protein
LVIAIFPVGHPASQNTFKNLVPEFPGTLPGAAVFHRQQGLVMGFTTTNPTVALGRIVNVVVPLKLIRAIIGKQGLVLVRSTWLGH